MEENVEKPKLSKSVLNITGTKANVQSGQLLVSSGIPSLDELLGGGIPVGTVVLLEEDRFGTYSKVVLKYFLAEGVVNKHSIFIASKDTSTDNILRELPAVASTDPEPSQKTSVSNEKLKIAFRYQNLPTAELQKPLEFGHFYDLTKTMSLESIEEADIVHWKQPKDMDAPDTFSNASYHHLLKNIKDKIKNSKFGVNDKPEKRSVLRIGIHALGSPMWSLNDSPGYALQQHRDLDMFIFCLRALMRSAFAVAVVTIPSHLLEKSSIDRCVYSSDIVIKLQAFAGTELEKNPILADYNGYFHVLKLAAINTFVSKHPGSVEYTFKLRRKKFCIEKLHLPPDMADLNKDKTPSIGCGSSSKHLLEF